VIPPVTVFIFRFCARSFGGSDGWKMIASAVVMMLELEWAKCEFEFWPSEDMLEESLSVTESWGK